MKREEDKDMDIPYARWYPAIAKRRSRRQYDAAQSLPTDLVTHLHDFCRQFRPFPEARAELVTSSVNDVFKGILGGYGKIKDAPAYVAFIGDTGSSHIQEAVGYTGEGFILEATALGLASCWVGGFFRQGVASTHAQLGSTEKIMAVSPLGYTHAEYTLEEKVMSNFGRMHQRKPLRDMISRIAEDQWPPWMTKSLEAARLAPSAINRQPWLFQIGANSITVSTRGTNTDGGVSKRLDCGIAMLHFEVAALSQGVHGKWQLREPPQVAKFEF